MSGWRRKGGGIGTYWGSVRGIGEPVGLNGKTSGIIPFVRVMDSLTLAISQGSLRRGSAACYLDISHPEIEEFLEIRKPSGDFNRKALNLHHGVLVTDEFMEAVRDGAEFILRSPKDGSERGKVDARSLFQKLVETRLATGEPYIIFIDQVNRSMPKHHRDLGLKVTTSNLCSRDHAADRPRPSRRRPHRGLLPVVAQPRDLGRVERRQAVHRGRHALPRQCAQRLHRPRAGRDGARQVQRRARALGRPRRDGLPLASCRRAACRSKGAMAKSWNLKIFKHIRAQVDEASMMLAKERGPCPDAADMGVMERFSCKMAIAPTASISIICRRHLGLHRADPGQHLHPQDAVGQLLDQEPVPREAARREGARTRDSGVELDPRAGRLASSTSTS